MIFEKNPFTTAVSIPKSFHLTPFLPTFEIHQPTLMVHSIILHNNIDGQTTVWIDKCPPIQHFEYVPV